MHKIEPFVNQPAKVLVIEDDLDIQYIICEAIESFIGISSLRESSGNAAIVTIQKERPDIIVCDFRMEDGDGKDVLDYLCSIESYRPHFFLFSAEVQMSLPERKLDHFEIIDKTDINKLIRKICRIVETRQS